MGKDRNNPCIDCNIEPRYKPHSRCHICYKKHRNKNRDVEKTNKQNRESLKRNYLSRRKYVYKTRYGITEEDYQNMLSSQDYRCAICGVHQDDQKIRMSVDHDHKCCPGLFSCGKCLRGLLCRNCNLTLGVLKDEEEILQAAINYLVYHRSTGGYLD